MPPRQPPFFPPPRKRARAQVERHEPPAEPETSEGSPEGRDSVPDVPFELIERKHASAFGVARSERSESVASYRAGDVLAGKYELLRLLGQGGMSAVWAVQNLVLDAQFALKLIRNDGGNAHAAERMLREARAAARVEHPAIIRMLDFGVTDRGDPFLVMDLLSGVTVRERLRTEGPFTPVEAVRLLLPIADALSVAHSHGVVHRDLKPDNIVCVAAGGGRCQPKVIDFGIARQMDQELPRITQSGMVLGSPEYMSPEQAQGLLDVGHQTDVWSFCVVLYEMVTGTTPFFRGGALGRVLDAIIAQPVPPIANFGIHDAQLWSILSRGLQKFPPARWVDMRSLGVALARWLIGQGVEEDVCMQSVRMAWLGTSSSTPPVAMDAGANEERAQLSALTEHYEVPKKGVFSAALGLVAAIFAMSLIGLAGFHAAYRSAPLAPLTSRGPPPLSPASTAHTSPAPVPSPMVPAPSALPDTEQPQAPEQAPKEEKAVVSAMRATPASEARRRSTRVAAKKEHKPALAPVELRATDTTVLPEVKPPPDFGGGASDNPYIGDEPSSGRSGKASAGDEPSSGRSGKASGDEPSSGRSGKASDNPYVGDEPSTGKAPDNPYVGD